MCLAHLHPKANISAKFHENWWKSEEVVRDAKFFPHVCHNMPLPWQHFLPLSKNVSCTSTPQGKHLCQISWELVKNDARLATDRPTARPPERPTDDTLIPIYPLIHYVYAGGVVWTHWKCIELRGSAFKVHRSNCECIESLWKRIRNACHPYCDQEAVDLYPQTLMIFTKVQWHCQKCVKAMIRYR